VIWCSLPISRCSSTASERDVATLVDELNGRRLITLTGVGGTGKTRLAVELARVGTDERAGCVLRRTTRGSAGDRRCPACTGRCVRSRRGEPRLVPGGEVGGDKPRAIGRARRTHRSFPFARSDKLSRGAVRRPTRKTLQRRGSCRPLPSPRRDPRRDRTARDDGWRTRRCGLSFRSPPTSAPPLIGCSRRAASARPWCSSADRPASGSG
jgi:hypothetical protein